MQPEMRERIQADSFLNLTFPSLPFLRPEWNVTPEAFEMFLT